MSGIPVQCPNRLAECLASPHGRVFSQRFPGVGFAFRVPSGAGGGGGSASDKPAYAFGQEW